MLGLGKVQNSLVGSPEKRGVSGGQKKRVNIGMELVAMPSFLFMDEPTRREADPHRTPQLTAHHTHLAPRS